MQLTLLKSKLHRATVTGASVDYQGSMTISEDIAECVGLLRYERILVSNMANGARFETYVIYGPRGTGVICAKFMIVSRSPMPPRCAVAPFSSMTPVPRGP